MSTIILNASPNGSKGNTQWFIEHFHAGYTLPCQVRYVVKENPESLAADLVNFDTILIFLPLYVHAMPGILRKVMEKMQPARRGQSIGFVMQAGFDEGQQSQYALKYFHLFAKRMGYRYLGTVHKGGCAGITLLPMPGFMTHKLRKKLAQLGKHFEQTGTFDAIIQKEFLQPYNLTNRQIRMMEFAGRLGLDELIWNRMLKKAGTFDKRRDCPYL